MVLVNFPNKYNCQKHITSVIRFIEMFIVFLKVCVKLAALSAEWPGRRKTYGPGETRTHGHAFRGHFSYGA